MNGKSTIGVEHHRFFKRILLVAVLIIFYIVGFYVGTAVTAVVYSKVSFLNDSDDYAETISKLF